MSVKGKCREQGCHVEWNNTAEYLSCQGCAYQTCKIREEYNKRQQRNAALEADRIIERMKHRQNKNEELLKETDSVWTKTFPVESYYVADTAEIAIEKEVAPVMYFDIKGN